MATYKEQISKAAAQQTSPPIQRLCADFDAQIGQWTPGNIEPMKSYEFVVVVIGFPFLRYKRQGLQRMFSSAGASRV